MMDPRTHVTGILVVWLLASGCAHEVGSDELPLVMEAEFDPGAEPSPKIPSPTDLIYDAEEGRLDFDLEPGDSAAQTDLVEFLNSLDGWPASMPGKATFLGEVDPATVTGETVRVLDISDLAYPQWLEGANLVLDPYENGEQELFVYPGLLPTWSVASRYAIVIMGGEDGVRGLGGETLVPSSIFWFFRASRPLAECEDQELLEGCESLTDLVDAEDVADLEEIRRDSEEVFDALDSMGVDRMEIALAWSFRTSTRTVVPFDPSIEDVHFPNDYYFSDDETHLEVPAPPGSTPEADALLARLNQTDGYSLTAPARMRFVGPLDPSRANLTPTAILFVNADEDEDYPLLERNWDETRNEVQIAPLKALHDNTRYAAVALDYLEDVDGEKVISSHIWSILKSHNPVTDSEGRSLLPSIDDETAQDLEEARIDYEDLFHELEDTSYPREKVQLGQVITTRSVVAEMQALRERPDDESLPTAVSVVGGIQDPGDVAPASMPIGNLSGVVEGTVPVLDVMDGSTSEISEEPGTRVDVPFLLTLPVAPPAGRTSAPVVIFLHDLYGSSLDVFAVADDLAAEGWASVAIDLRGHGGRGDGTDATEREALLPVSNPFAAGDAMRHQALEVVAVARSLTATDGFGDIAGVSIDTTDIALFGIGFGAMAGSIFMAVDPTVQVAVLTGAGGNLGKLAATSSAYAGDVDAWLTDDLGLTEGSEAHTFYRYAWSWAADPGDPGVFAHHLIAAPLPDPDGPGDMPTRSMLVQVPMLDEIIPEPVTRFFWLSMGRDLYPVLFEDSEVGFILDRDDSTGAEAREQAVVFIASGGETTMPVGG